MCDRWNCSCSWISNGSYLRYDSSNIKFTIQYTRCQVGTILFNPGSATHSFHHIIKESKWNVTTWLTYYCQISFSLWIGQSDSSKRQTRRNSERIHSKSKWAQWRSCCFRQKSFVESIFFKTRRCLLCGNWGNERKYSWEIRLQIRFYSICRKETSSLQELMNPLPLFMCH